MFKKISKVLILILFVSLFVPFFSAGAKESYFTYRSTEMGGGTRQTGQWEYAITDEKTDFSSNESVFALTRIFNITNVDTFQFKYEIRGITDRDMFSPVYQPNGNWWAEIWYWDEFGQLPAGLYTLRAMISVDNGAFKYLDDMSFRVSGRAYSDSTYKYNDYSNESCNNPDYDFDWVETGKNIKSIGSYAQEIINPARSFKTTENVYVLVKNEHINGVGTFRIKFDVYLNGNRYYKTNEVPTLHPNCKLWAYNYSWANLGRLPAGNHEIRTSIKLNNGSYRLLNTRSINVGSTSHTSGSYYTAPSSRDHNYAYSWTETDSNISFRGNYKYSIENPRDQFKTYEEIKVLTRLSTIRNVDNFRIRHELHKNGNYITKRESANQRPGGNDWEYNFTQSNFGKLSTGNYVIRVYISVEGKAWRYLDSKNIQVGNPTNQGSSVNDRYYNGYDWTQVGTDFNDEYYYYYSADYPDYVNFPFSDRQL